MTDSGPLSILSAVYQHLRKAQAPLGQRGAPDAVSRGQHHLQQVDELLAQGVDEAVTDVETLQAMVALRNTPLGAEAPTNLTELRRCGPPSCVIATIQATAIRATSRAYSTETRTTCRARKPSVDISDTEHYSRLCP